MKIQGLVILGCVGIAMGTLAGCASAPPDDAAKSVGVYTSTELAGQPYDIVGHIWADSWQTAFRLPTYPTAEQAVASLKVEAARLGADGLVNVVCLDQGRGQLFSLKEEAGFLCYGGAIRLRRSAG